MLCDPAAERTFGVREAWVYNVFPQLMICPECHTPNPDQAENCSECRHSLSDPNLGTHTPGSEADFTATMDGPSTLKEWFSSSTRSMALVLPEGLEIGHRYEVIRLLGVGGMGSVYKVHDRGLDRDVALKLIRSDIADNPPTLARFKREIQLSSTVTHKNVLRVYDLGEADGIKFLTMQLVEGTDLGHVLKREGKLPFARILKIFGQVCEGLGAAHEQGVIHRDLKPQNIMLDAKDNVFVMDFGLAKSLEQSGMTQDGAIVGTPYYMSPEQVKGDTIGARSDIYSLGVILYEMASGQLPYTGRTPYEVMVQRTLKPPKPPDQINPEIPPYLGNIIQRCLAIDPALRYGSTGEILEDLREATFRPTMRYRIRRRRWLVPSAAVAAAVLIVATAWWATRHRSNAAPAGPQKTTSVLIADFQNKTGDPVFDGTLEPAFGLSLEGASFITSYNRGQAHKLAAQLQPGSAGLGEPLARLVAVREGVQVVTSGSIEKKDSDYVVTVRAVDAVTGKTVAETQEKASGKGAVLGSVARAAADVRGALGDTTPSSVQLAAAETFSAGSLDAAHEYAVAQDLQYGGDWDGAVRHYRKAIDLDPNLGRAYAGIAAVESNRGNRAEAEKYYKEAFARIDRMSDREKYRTRGGYFLITRNPDNAIEEFSALVKQFPADTAGIANLAASYFYKRDMARALQEARRAVQLSPQNVPQRNNLGLDAMYAGNFEDAIKEQDEVLRLNPKFLLAYVSKAMSQVALGKIDVATQTYQKAAALDARGASVASMGLADIAMYQGRSAEALPGLLSGAEADVSNKDPEAAAVKLLAVAEIRLETKDTAGAVAEAERAIALARGENVLYPAARVFIATGREQKALALATELGGRLEPDPQAYGELIRGEEELARGKTAEAIRHFTAARKIADTWAGRLDMGKAYLEGGALAQADAEFDVCVKRRGEATALFLDESPTCRLIPTAYYYQGRAREGLKSPGAADAFKMFLSAKTGPGDALVADARKRVAAK
jgi:tetratricopeptide (TPR) repeat protein